MSGDLVHLMTETPDPKDMVVVCGDRLALYATWKTREATCPTCLRLVRQPCTCAQGQTCDACTQWRKTHRANGTRKEPMSEKHLQGAVTRLLKLHHWLWYHTYDARRSPVGFPDLIAVRDNRLICLELKRQDGEVSHVQHRWLKALAQVDTVHTAVWRPSDLLDAPDLLR